VKTLNLLPCPRSVKRLPGTLQLPDQQQLPPFSVLQSDSAPDHPEGYAITIDRQGVKIEFRETAGLRVAMATMRQLMRQFGRHSRLAGFFAPGGDARHLARARPKT
jgi:hypothetical protein